MNLRDGDGDGGFVRLSLAEEPLDAADIVERVGIDDLVRFLTR